MVKGGHFALAGRKKGGGGNLEIAVKWFLRLCGFDSSGP